MISEKVRSLVEATGGELLVGDGSSTVTGIFTDSRKPQPRGLFIAIDGAVFDGHEFVESAVRGGAGALLVSRLVDEQILRLNKNLAVIKVANTRQAYLDLASFHRDKLKGHTWFGITGSQGKSTVKEMLAFLLSRSAGWKTHWAVKSFNNEIGVPATILGAARDHQAVVLELGTNAPGEIERLARVARPQIAIITNAGPTHLEGLRSIKGVAREKSHILDFQGREDTAILNADDPYCAYWISRARGRVMTFGVSPSADVRAIQCEMGSDGCHQFTLGVSKPFGRVRLKVPGLHNVRNALAATSAALAAGLDVKSAVRGLEAFEGLERRFQQIEVDGITLIDDAYNASPSSFKAALDVLEAFKDRRIIIVAGDMLELGKEAEAYHRELGHQIAHLSPDALVTVGHLAQMAGRMAVNAGLPDASWTATESAGEASRHLANLALPGDVVLVKGSNGMGLNRVIEGFVQGRSRMSA